MHADDRAAVDRVFANVGKALAAYQRRLRADDAPLDEFVAGLRAGDPERIAALDAEAQRGLLRFVGSGRCVLCHSGPAFTDLEFHETRVPPAPGLDADPGRHAGILPAREDAFRATGPYSDAPDSDVARKIDWIVDPSGRPHHDVVGQFKTPGLRNVTRSAPYMHQGQLADLDAVLEHYSSLAGAPPVRGHVERFFEPLHLDAAARSQLLAFLRSLEDRSVDATWMSPPASPIPPGRAPEGD
jgi:cytochrome c peroxidase